MGRVMNLNPRSLNDMIKEVKTPKSDSRAPSGRVHPLVRAFRVDVTDWPEASCIVRTVKASRAKPSRDELISIFKHLRDQARLMSALMYERRIA